MGIFKDLMEKWACKHEWETRYTHRILAEGGKDGDIPIEIRSTMICKKCGKITKIKL